MLHQVGLIFFLSKTGAGDLVAQAAETRVEMAAQGDKIIDRVADLELIANVFHLVEEVALGSGAFVQQGRQRPDAGGEIEADGIDALGQGEKVLLDGGTGFVARVEHLRLCAFVREDREQLVDGAKKRGVVEGFGAEGVLFERLNQKREGAKREFTAGRA